MADSEELLGRISAALHERDRLREYVAKLEAFGGQLANIAYNLKQNDKLDKNTRACLEASQKGFDEARRTNR